MMIIDAKKYSGKCSCGKSHVMVTELAVIESNVLKKFNEYRQKYFPETKHVTAIYDKNTYAAVSDKHPEVDCEIVLSPENLHADEKACAIVLEKLSTKTDLLVAVGAGTVHDVTRYCANKKGIQFVACPTAASVDGFCSSVAAMTWEGFKKTMPGVAPKLVLADVDIIANAPMRLTNSGFGDMVGKYIALSDWKIANAITGEFLCERIYSLMMEATKTAIDCADGLAVRDKTAIEKLMGGLILSGLAMQMMGNSRPASGAEHHISHIIEMQPSGLGVSSSALHGEKVGVATLLLCEEYHRLATEKINWKDYEPLSKECIEKVFGSRLVDSVMQENVNDCAFNIKASDVTNNIDKICQIIANIPQKDKLLGIYEKLGAMKSLTDLGVDEKLKDKLFFYSPTVRNRLTLMRLRQSAKI